jgi:hypothetical protein
VTQGSLRRHYDFGNQNSSWFSPTCERFLLTISGMIHAYGMNVRSWTLDEPTIKKASGRVEVSFPLTFRSHQQLIILQPFNFPVEAIRRQYVEQALLDYVRRPAPSPMSVSPPRCILLVPLSLTAFQTFSAVFSAPSGPGSLPPLPPVRPPPSTATSLPAGDFATSDNSLTGVTLSVPLFAC